MFGIRPEHLTCSPDQSDHSSARTLQAVVELVQPMGVETYLHLAGHTRPFIARVPPADRARANDKVSFACDLRHAHFFDPASGKAIQ